jgi:hypothetical protein
LVAAHWQILIPDATFCAPERSPLEAYSFAGLEDDDQLEFRRDEKNFDDNSNDS